MHSPLDTVPSPLRPSPFLRPLPPPAPPRRVQFVTIAFSQSNNTRAFVDSFYYTVDQAIGYIMFVLIAFLSFLGVVGVLQMKLLFNDAFAQTAGHARIARAMIDNKVGRRGGCVW